MTLSRWVIGVSRRGTKPIAGQQHTRLLPGRRRPDARVVIYEVSPGDDNAEDRVLIDATSASVTIDGVGSGGDQLDLTSTSARVTTRRVGSGSDQITITTSG